MYNTFVFFPAKTILNLAMSIQQRGGVQHPEPYKIGLGFF
jgi:hypothetical protein